MSRTRLAILTAAGLAAVTLAVMAARRHVLGPDVERPHGPDTWKVTMLVQGRSTGAAKVVTTTPLDSPRQHVVREQWGGDGLAAKPQGTGATDRRSLLWTERPDATPGSFRVRYDCYVTLMTSRSRLPAGTTLEVPPGRRDLLGETGIEAEHPAIADLARTITAGLGEAIDQARAVLSGRRVDRQRAESGGGAVGCGRLFATRRRGLGGEKSFVDGTLSQPWHPGATRHRPDADPRG